MSRSLTDLAGVSVTAEDFLGGVLEAVAQPVWVVDPEGLIRFANPAAIAALGYDNADELLSLPDVDGALAGGASLDVGDFVAIVEAARS